MEARDYFCLLVIPSDLGSLFSQFCRAKRHSLDGYEWLWGAALEIST